MRTVRVLSVCAHNRTRSVLIGALLTRHFEEVGIDGAVRAVGFGEPGLPATSETIRFLATRGIDVRQHRSRRITGDDVARADLIVTAERIQVVEIAGRWPGTFAKTMTLPELVQRGEHQPGTASSVPSWLEALAHGRPHDMDYLDAHIDEIADPTGGPPSAWRSCVDLVDDLTMRMARLFADEGPR